MKCIYDLNAAYVSHLRMTNAFKVISENVYKSACLLNLFKKNTQQKAMSSVN